MAIPKGVRAYSDYQGHILIKIGNDEHGMDLTCALRLLRDLRTAVDVAIGIDEE